METVGISLQDKRVCITGTLWVPRSQITRMLIDAGAKVVSGVTKKTDILICGENPGIKEAQARHLGVTTISEAQFRAWFYQPHPAAPKIPPVITPKPDHYGDW